MSMSKVDIVAVLDRIFQALEFEDAATARADLSRLGEQLRADILEKQAAEWRRQQPRDRSKPKAKGKGKGKSKHEYHERLNYLAARLGFDGYADYLHSPNWKDFKKLYAQAWPDCRCVGCLTGQYDLHHVTYERLGAEEFTDLLPLCRECHRALHRTHRDAKIPLADFRAALIGAFGWSGRQLEDRLAPYCRLPKREETPAPVVPAPAPAPVPVPVRIADLTLTPKAVKQAERYLKTLKRHKGFIVMQLRKGKSPAAIGHMLGVSPVYQAMFRERYIEPLLAREAK